MTPRHLSQLLLLTASLSSFMTLAAPVIPLDEASITHLGILFDTPRHAEPGEGNVLPAQVTNSPEALLTVVTRYPGQLLHWHVQVGDELSAGAVVATLESEEILSLQGEWLSALRAQALADERLARDESLFDSGIIAAQRLAMTREEKAQAGVLLTRTRLALRQLGVDDAGFQALEEGQGLGQLQLKSPHAGRVSRRHHTVGATLPAMSPLLSLSDDQRWVEANVPWSLSRTLVPGATLRLAEHDLDLTLVSLDETVNPGQQTRTLLARLDGAPPTSLLPGQIVRLHLPIPEEALLIPARSVVHHQGESLIYVQHSEGVEPRPVTLLPVGDSYLVLQGLAPTERLVTRGAALLKGMQLEQDTE